MLYIRSNAAAYAATGCDRSGRSAREAGADLIVTVGGGSITDGAKAVQLCLANDIRTTDALDDYRPVKGPDGALGPPPCNAPSVRQITVPTTLSAGEFSAIAGVTDERHRVKELSVIRGSSRAR